MKHLLLLALVFLGGCAGSEFRRVGCPGYPDEIKELAAKPEAGRVFSTKTGQLYQWSEFKERYVPDTEWETAVVGEKFKMRTGSWVDSATFDEIEINLKDLTVVDRVTFRDGKASVIDLTCVDLPIQHPIDSPGS